MNDPQRQALLLAARRVPVKGMEGAHAVATLIDELEAGKAPSDGQTVIQVARATIDAGCPGELARAMVQLLEAMEERPRSMKDVGEAKAEFVASALQKLDVQETIKRKREEQPET